MGTSADYMTWVREQAMPHETLSCRRMFGEYAAYIDGKVVALVCDNVVYLKPTDAVRALLGTPDEAPAYPGGKPWFRLGEIVEDRDRFRQLLRATADALPMPKPKKPRAGNSAATQAGTSSKTGQSAMAGKSAGTSKSSKAGEPEKAGKSAGTRNPTKATKATKATTKRRNAST